MSETMTDAARDPRLPPSANRSDWIVLRILRTYSSWAGPIFTAGEVASFNPREAHTMVALGWARSADAPDPETIALLPQRVRVVREFVDPTTRVTYGCGERVQIDGGLAADLITAGVVVPDDGRDAPPTAQDARLARARERREARGRQ